VDGSLRANMGCSPFHQPMLALEFLRLRQGDGRGRLGLVQQLEELLAALAELKAEIGWNSTTTRRGARNGAALIAVLRASKSRPVRPSKRAMFISAVDGSPRPAHSFSMAAANGELIVAVQEGD